MSKSILPIFSSRSFMVSGLTFKSSTLLELSFVYSMRKCFVSVLFSHWVMSDSLRPMDYRMPSYSVLHYLLGFAQTVRWGNNGQWTILDNNGQNWTIMLSISPSATPFFVFSLSQHQCLFRWVGSSHQIAKVLELQLDQQSFQWIFRTDFL